MVGKLKGHGQEPTTQRLLDRAGRLLLTEVGKALMQPGVERQTKRLREGADQDLNHAPLMAAKVTRFTLRLAVLIERHPHRRQDKAGCPSILHRYAARGTSSKLLVS